MIQTLTTQQNHSNHSEPEKTSWPSTRVNHRQKYGENEYDNFSRNAPNNSTSKFSTENIDRLLGNCSWNLRFTTQCERRYSTSRM